MTRRWVEWVAQIRCSLHRQATILLLVALFVVGMSLPIAAQQATAPQIILPTAQTVANAKTLEQQGRQRYEAAQYAEAVALWQSAIAAFKANGDGLGKPRH